MFIIQSYTTAVIFCIITMICWGSWANTQKLVANNWRFELYYWDYVIGILFFSLLSAFTFGSNGEYGRSFLVDIKQAYSINLISAFVGGVIFNAANILFSAAISLTGMAVAFPIGIGIALVFGVIINYFGQQQGNPFLIFIGTGFVVIAILLNALAYKQTNTSERKISTKGIVISILAGVLMSFFYRFIAISMELDNLVTPAIGKLTSYTAVFTFSVGVLISNLVFNTILMYKPFSGGRVTYKDYFKGGLKTHLIGLLGGIVWGLGNSFNLIAAGKAGTAVSYGLGQGATLIAAFWGVVVWKEFRGSTTKTSMILKLMFIAYIIGLVLIVLSI